uniref:Uncharacterized protein n=1 Tax=Acrobeloides nanus TaxID=290746 RepID=A0A914BY95_9BILA
MKTIFVTLFLSIFVLVSIDASWDGPVVTIEREEKIPSNQPIAAQEDEVTHNRIIPSYRTDEKADGSHVRLVSSTITSGAADSAPIAIYSTMFTSILCFFVWSICAR